MRGFSIFCRFSLSDTFELLFESLPLESCSPSNFHSMNAQETSCSKFNDEILQHEKEVSQLEKDILILQEELLECDENVEGEIDQAVYKYIYQSCTLLHTHIHI